MHIFTDAAAGSGCSYHISQYHQQKDVYLPLAWGSHKFSATEASYSQVVAELYGIIYALADNPYFLQWSRVFVHTDAKPLSYLLKFKQINQKLNRWYLFLANFDLHIIWEESSSVGIRLADIFTRQFGGTKTMNKRITKDQENSLPNISLPKDKSTSFQEAEILISDKLNSSNIKCVMEGPDEEILDINLQAYRHNYDTFLTTKHAVEKERVYRLKYQNDSNIEAVRMTFDMEDYQNGRELIDDSSLLAQASTHRPSTSKQTEPQDMSMIAHRYKMSSKQIKKVLPTPPTPYVLQHGTEKDQDLTMTTQLMDLVFRENPDWSTGKLTELQKQDPLFRNVFDKIATKDPTASDFI